MESNDEMTEEELKKKAYLMGQRLKASGLDAEAVYARLEKNGVPEEMARHVVRDIWIERRKEIAKENETVYNFALIRIAIGLAIALIAHFIFPGVILLPIGIMVGGIVSAFVARKRMEE